MAFPRTTVAGVSLPRLLIGSNWIFGWSHTGHAADVYIKKYHSMVDATLSVLNAFLEYGIDAWMAPFSSHPDALDKIKRIQRPWKGGCPIWKAGVARGRPVLSVRERRLSQKINRETPRVPHCHVWLSRTCSPGR